MPVCAAVDPATKRLGAWYNTRLKAYALVFVSPRNAMLRTAPARNLPLRTYKPKTLHPNFISLDTVKIIAQVSYD